MGVKKLTEEEIDRKRIAGLNIKAYRKEKGWTQEKCAEEWGLSPLTIRRLELNAEPNHRGEYPATKKTAEQIAKKTGIFWKYWYGFSEIRDQAQYEQAVSEEIEHDIAASAALDEMYRDFIRQVEAYRGLFSMLGYEYENMSNDAKYAFWSMFPDGPNYSGPHNLTPADGTGKTLNLSDAQMEALIAYLKKQLDFAVFDLSRVAP